MSNTKDLPGWIPVDLWNEYLAMRKKIRKPMTPFAEEIAIKKLAAFRENGCDINAILEQSIFNSWQGLFEIRQEKKVDSTNWASSEQGTLAMASQVGLVPRSGEGWGELRARIRKALDARH